MIDLIKEASVLQFALGYMALISFIMSLFQAMVNKEVWAGYLIILFGSLLVLGLTLR